MKLESICGIYKIQSIINPEKIYIGSAVNTRGRQRIHLTGLKNNKHHSAKLQNHYNLYGEEDLVFSNLIACSRENLIIIEQTYLNAHQPYFNICPTAGNTLGRKHTHEAKKKISDSKKGKTPWLGRKHTAESRAKMSEWQKGKKCTEKELAQLREMNLKGGFKKGNTEGLGRKHTEESKAKIRLAKKINNVWIGRKHTPETLVKLGKTHLGNTYNKGRRYKLKAPRTEEFRQKVSWGLKKYYTEVRLLKEIGGNI